MSIYTTDDATKTEHLRALDGAKERLHLFKANLLEEGSFDSVVDGCEGVFHTASPVSFTPTNPQVELIDPALKGTLNVLRSCAKVTSIKRVVLTSSLASVLFNGKPRTPDVVVDETWFSDPVYCEEVKPTLNLTMEEILKLIDGAQTFPNTNARFVDVRDVALAHIKAFEIPSASGRYCLVGRLAYWSEVVKILRDLYPALHLPQCADDKAFEPFFIVSKEKAKSLGINFIPLEVSLKDTVESLKASNFFSF